MEHENERYTQAWQTSQSFLNHETVICSFLKDHAEEMAMNKVCRFLSVGAGMK